MNEGTSLEVTKLQLQQSIETYRAQMSLLVQVCTVLVIADATTIGYAIQQKLAGIVPIGGIFSATIIGSIWHVTRLSIPILSTAVNIEKRYKVPGASALVSNFVSFRYGSEILEKIGEAASQNSNSDRAQALKQLRIPAFPGAAFTKWFLIVITLGHAVAPWLLHHYANWRWFYADVAK